MICTYNTRRIDTALYGKRIGGVIPVASDNDWVPFFGSSFEQLFHLNISHFRETFFSLQVGRVNFKGNWSSHIPQLNRHVSLAFCFTRCWSVEVFTFGNILKSLRVKQNGISVLALFWTFHQDSSKSWPVREQLSMFVYLLHANNVPKEGAISIKFKDFLFKERFPVFPWQKLFIYFWETFGSATG